MSQPEHDSNMQASNNSESADSERNILLREDELQHVLAMVPSEDRVRMRTVSKLFNKTFTRIGYHLDPLLVYELTDRGHCFTSYSFEIPIQLHPMFRSCIYGYENPEHTAYDKLVKFWLAPNRNDMEERHQEFITSPPISTVYVSYSAGPGGPSQAILRTATAITKRPEGVLAGDLLEAFDKMNGHNLRARMDDFITIHATSNEITITEEGPAEKAGRKRSADDMEGDDGSDGNDMKKAKGASTFSSRITVRPHIEGMSACKDR
jgi:hypothetical protein